MWDVGDKESEPLGAGSGGQGGMTREDTDEDMIVYDFTEQEFAEKNYIL